MAAESSKRSRLIDVTNKQLHLLLTGWEVSATEEDTEETLLPRVEALKNVRRPFGKPNSESRKKVDSGVVTLRDGVVVRLDNNDKPYVFAISSKFNIDEVEALILFRSFLYNEVAEETGSNTDDPIIQSFVKTFTPFYHSERRCLARLYVPLFRAHDHEGTLFHSTAQRILPDIIPVGSTFVGDIIQEYLDLINAPLPDDVLRDPRAASIWAKECLKDQLVLLEVLFWAVWAYIPHRGSIVVQIYEAAYSTSLGSTQQNPTLLLDEEGYRIQQDCAAIWLLIMLEILDLEFFADHGAPDLIVPPSKGDLLMKSPESLKKIHHLIIAHGDSQYAAIYLAWAIVLPNLEAAVAQLDKCPPAYQEFFDTLDPRGLRPYSKNGEPIHKLMLQRCLDPSVGLFNLLLSILTTSPVFVISISWHTDSAVTDPNAIAYRAVIKGLLIGLSETLPVELIPDFDTFVEVWITLFGRGESQSVAGICQQFWLHDTLQSPARRAIFDVTRSRFPVHFRPLVRLLNAMTGSGFTDADPLASMGHGTVSGVSAQRSLCSRHVSAFFDALPTYTQVIPTNACIGPHALYEKLPERYGSSSLHGLTYVNTRPILLPGGTLLPARTQGRLLSQDGEDYIIVAWQREHSGWRLLVDVLADYARRRRLIPTATPPFTQNRATAASPVVLQLADIGIEVDSDGDYSVVTDALEFLRAVIVDSDALAEEVLASIDQVEPGSNPQGEAPSLVQLTMLILEDALSRSASQPRKAPDSHLITAAFSVLSSLLRAPKYTPQVWLFTRSATSLFDTDRNSASASAVITAERSSGLYPITRSLLRFVHDLYHQALSALVVPDGMERLPGAKEDVLLRALRFVHAEIWVEHNGWKYAQLGHRFEIGRLISTLYGDILEHTLPGSGTPLSTLSQAVLDALISKATTSSIAPLIVALTTSSAVTDRLGSSRRLGDLKGLFSLLRMHLRVLRLSLTYKQRLHGDAGVCLLEQALCSRAGSGGSTFPSNRNQMGALDVLSTLAEDSSADPYVPLEAIRVLGALCTSLSMSHPTAPTILGHLSDPQKTVTQLVQIAHHPYQEADVRVAVWRFMALAVEKEPALGNLFIAGRLRIQDNGTSQESPDKKSEQSQANGLEAASAILINWKDYWDVNPELLSTALGFLSAVWERGMEHKGMLEATRKNATLWSAATDIAKEELSQAAHYQSTEYMGGGDEGPRSTLHENISMYASQVLCKAHAIRIIAFDIDLDRNFTGGRLKPQSYQAIEPVFKSEDTLSGLLSDAVATAYDPALYDGVVELIKTSFPGLSLEYFESRLLPIHREFGDAFAFSLNMLRDPLHSSDMTERLAMEAGALVNGVFSISMNLSLAHASRELCQSWRSLLVTAAPFLRGVSASRPVMLALAADISNKVATEERSGELMSDIHGVRLSLLLALLELAWFSSTDSPKEKENFIKLIGNVHDMVVNEAHSPIESVRGSITTSFHRSLLQIIYFCARQSRNMAGRPKFLTAENRLAVSSMVDATHVFVVDSLRFVFGTARMRLDADIDVDLELLVAVFKECTRRDISPSSTQWLTRCQETDVIRASLELFVQTDLTGLSTLPFSRRKQPLYSPHILTFHVALASLPGPAERLASEGILIAYSNSRLGTGPIDVTLPELPGERNPAHTAYCVMLAVVSGVFSSLGMQKHFFGAEASGFVRLFGNQIAGVLAWTVGDPISLALVEEMERVVELFHAIAMSASSAGGSRRRGERAGPTEGVLAAFSTNALLLLQQLNYALTHPNQVASLLEPVTAEERMAAEKDQSDGQASAGTAVVDPVKRPFLARLVHRLLGLTSSIVCTLVVINRSDTVLRGDIEDVPTWCPLIVPHSKVVLGEPASMGTLLELTSSALDVLSQLVARPTGQALAPPSSISTSVRGAERALDVGEARHTARQTVEVVLMYAATQLGMWLERPEGGDGAGADGEMEEMGEGGERRRESSGLSERVRRGMVVEMGGELRALMERARGVQGKSREGETVDITDVLLRFLNEHVMKSG